MHLFELKLRRRVAPALTFAPFEGMVVLGFMVNAQQLKDRMTNQPFKPFKLCLSDGKTFDITNHDAAFVKRNAIEIGLDADPNGLAERFVECAIIHINRIEDLVAA